MRHRVDHKALSRDTKQRKALVKNLLASLFQHGAIETTSTKAKVIKRLADKVITKGKPRTLNARRVLESFFGSRQVVNHIIDAVVPALEERTSGFTRITRLGRRRGDDADMVKIELVAAPVARETASVRTAEETSRKQSAAVATAAKAPATKPVVKRKVKASKATPSGKASAAKKTK